MKASLSQISGLVERFERNIEAYRSPTYNEAQLRSEFLDPFFEALGWDVSNKEGYAEQYKDVPVMTSLKKVKLINKPLEAYIPPQKPLAQNRVLPNSYV